jgi:hypothetical protein
LDAGEAFPSFGGDRCGGNQSVAVAVGHGEDEHPLASVGRSGIGCSKHRPLRIEPERGQVSENSPELH